MKIFSFEMGSGSNVYGFSLIELSIVLIVVAVLIVGVTSGSYLMRTANLQSVVREVANYKKSIGVFFEKKGRLPGSLDNSFEFDRGVYAWVELYSDGLINSIPNVVEQFSDYDVRYNVNMQTKLPFLKEMNTNSKLKDGWYALGYRANGNSTSRIYAKNSIALFGGNSIINNPSDGVIFDTNSLAISLSDALFLDSKTDDGDLDTGSTIGIGSSVNSNDNGYCGGFEIDKVSKPNVISCVMFFDIGL